VAVPVPVPVPVPLCILTSALGLVLPTAVGMPVALPPCCAGHFGPDPLARDDASGAVLATRHVRVLPTTTPFKKFAPKREQSAERRIQPMPPGTICVAADQCLSGAARAADKCTQSAQLICFRGALAFRRSAAALARALTP
jgi:hypothetical protein